MRILCSPFTSWEKPILVRTAHQCRSIVVDVFIDDGGHVFIKFEGQVDLVIDCPSSEILRQEAA